MPDKKFATVRQHRRPRNTGFCTMQSELRSVDCAASALPPLSAQGRNARLSSAVEFALGRDGRRHVWSLSTLWDCRAVCFSRQTCLCCMAVSHSQCARTATPRRLSTVALMDGPSPSKTFACGET